MVDGKKVDAEIKFKFTCVPDSLYDTLTVNATDNVNAKIEGKELTVTFDKMNNNTDAKITLMSKGITGNYEFTIVKDGVNVDTYDDLINCTNKSTDGEIVVLRKSFESLNYVNTTATNNTEIFGNYNSKKDSYSFKNEIYQFETTFNNEFIKQWNEFAKSNSNYKQISSKVNVGLRVQKDFYGNGYTINMHNLTYPSLITRVEQEGVEYEIPTLSANDLYQGPLPFYTLGDPNSLPLVTAYGQDNVGIYVDGDNITVNDVNIKNCDMGASLQFLETVGTVLEVNGDNNTIKNCRLSNGRNVLRSFSSNNLLIDNSLLSNSMNFLITTGSNEYIPYDELSNYGFTNYTDGSKNNTTIKEHLGTNAIGDQALNDYLMGNYTNIDLMRRSLLDIQGAMNDESKIEGQYKGSMTINDTYFYHSGLAGICFETLFNGPFLYTQSPSMVSSIFNMLSYEGRPIVPYSATKVSGLSYPVTVELTGDTKFYDYKVANDVDLSGLIEENISMIASEVLGEEKNITIDDVFPLKPMLVSQAKSGSCIYSDSDKEYINIPVAYYGGATNISKLITNDLNKSIEMSNIEIDFFDRYIKLTSDGGSLLSKMKDVMMKCVTIVVGFEPFEFVCVNNTGYLYGETPNVSDLIANAKEV